MNSRFSLLLGLILTMATGARAEWNDCPTATGGRQLTQWRETLVSKIIENKYEEVRAALDNCFGTNVPSCYQDMNYYVDSRRSPNYGTGAPYSREELTIDYSDLPAEFRTGEGLVRVPSNIVKLSQERGWKTLAYKTRSSGGFDTAPNLFMMNISTPEREVFLQTQPHPDTNPEATADNPVPNPSNGNISEGMNTLTVITVDKTKNPPVGQMRIMSRVGDEGYRWNNDITFETCTSCHTTPLRPISPLGWRNVNGTEQPMSAADSRTTDELNAILGSYVSWGKRNFNGREVRLGPPLNSQPTGWAPENSPTRQEAFLRECATSQTSFSYSGFGNYRANLQMSNPPQINYQRLGEAMNCFECHNDKNRGKLHDAYADDEIQFKIAVDRTMPHNIELNKDERIALISCLPAEKSQLRDTWLNSGEWMKQSPCFGRQFATPPRLPLGQTPATSASPARGARTSQQ